MSALILSLAATAKGEGEKTASLAALGFGRTAPPTAAAPLAPSPPSVGGVVEVDGGDGTGSATTGQPPSRSETRQPARQSGKPVAGWWPLRLIESGLGTRPATPSTSAAAAARPSGTTASGAGPRQLTITSIADATPARRFDPQADLAGHLVSDDRPVATEFGSGSVLTDGDDRFADDPTGGPGLRIIATEPDTEHSASVSDEPTSLVTWLNGHGVGRTSCDADEPLPDGCLTGACCPTWEAQVDALFLWQGNIPSRPLYVQTATRRTALDVNQLQNEAAIAPRYAILYNRDQCRAIEVNYFQLWGFDASRQLGPQLDDLGNGAFTGSNLAGLAATNTAAAIATSSAHIQSLEVNLRRRDDGVVQWISGFRWLEWGQSLGIESARVTDPQPPVYDALSVTTLNSLYGWQWGGDVTVWNAGRWLRVNGVGKAGVFYNHQASQNTSYTDFTQPTTRLSDANDAVSFVGEAGVTGSWSITNWLSWRAGYSFFWLSGVAVPANQLARTNIVGGTATVSTTGSVYLHGVTTGLEARW